MRHANTQRNVFSIQRLEENGVHIIGTSPKSIELAEDRKLFAKLLDDLGLNQAPSGTATSLEEAWRKREKTGSGSKNSTKHLPRLPSRRFAAA